MIYKQYASQIRRLKKLDDNLRNQLIIEGKLSLGYNIEMEQLHIKNAKELDVIIDRIGYPTEEKVGKKASDDAWIIVQHAISKPSFMKKCLNLLNIEAKANKVDPLPIAYLKDRIDVFEGRPQLHGTQFDWDLTGKLSPSKYDDLLAVNQRRKVLGLNTLEEQTNIIREQAIKENQSPPADLNKRNKERDIWRKKVGWVN